MYDERVLDRAVERPVHLPAQGLGARGSGGHRLTNLEKLYHVPVFALRQLLEARGPGRGFGHLRQAELVAEADRIPGITTADVDELYENYRYGRRLSFYFYLLPEGLAQPDSRELQDALDELAVSEDPSLANEVAASEDLESETSASQVTLLDEESLDHIREIRFRYYVIHRFLNTDEEPDRVLQTRYGFLWLDLNLGYLAILSRDERINVLLMRALSNCLQAIPVPVHFAKELVDKHFSLEKVKRVSYYDPGTGVRQSLSGKGLWQTFEQEILAHERRYARPSSLYEEEVADGVTSGLGVTSSKGKIYLTKTLPASQVRVWAMQRLPDLVRDVKDLRAEQPYSFDRSTGAINRMRLPSIGKAAIVTIVEGLLQTEREDMTSALLPQTALAIYDALSGKYFDPYLRAQCSQCEETADLCPHCESYDLEFGEKQVQCKACGATISDEEWVALRCMNGHVTGVPRDEAWSIAPNHWLQKRIVRIFAEISQVWDEQDDYFHVEGSTLYRLRRGQFDGDRLPQIVQNYINNFWDPVTGQIHAGSGDIIANGPLHTGTGDIRVDHLQYGMDADDLVMLFEALHRQVEEQAPPDKMDEALHKVDELQEAIEEDEPDLGTMESVLEWFKDNVPLLAGAVASVILNPIVGKVVEAAGELIAEEFRRRFGGYLSSG